MFLYPLSSFVLVFFFIPEICQIINLHSAGCIYCPNFPTLYARSTLLRPLVSGPSFIHEENFWQTYANLEQLLTN